MSHYLKLYNDIKEISRYIQERCDEKLDEEDFRVIIKNIAEAHEMHLVECEIQTILLNLRVSKKEITREVK
jgi:hypothetical protein